MNTKQLIIGLLIFAAVVAFFIWLYNRNAKATASTTTAVANEMAARAMVSQFSQATGNCYCGTSNTPVPVNSQAECAQKCGTGTFRFVPNLSGTARAIR